MKFLRHTFNVIAFIPLLLLLASYYAIHVDPQNSKIFPLIAYGFPYIVLLNLVVIIALFLFKFWKTGLLNLVVFALGYSYHTRIFALGSPEEIRDGDLKILSYNVRIFDKSGQFEIDRELIRDSILDFLVRQEADIYCFQEFHHEILKKKKSFVSLDDVFKATDTKFLATTNPVSDDIKRYTGNFIFSKYPIIHQDILDLTSENPIHGKCVFADIELEDKTIIRVYNFHLASIRYQEEQYDFVESLSPKTKLDEENKTKGKRVAKMFLDAARRRSQELEIVLEHAATSPYPTILCGDLNDTPSSNAYHRLRSRYKDAFQQAGRGFGKTYSGRMPSNRIDYIFHSEHFTAIDFFIQKEVLSDHQAIRAVLRLD